MGRDNPSHIVVTMGWRSSQCATIDPRREASTIMNKIVASFFFAIGILFVLGGIPKWLGLREGSAVGPLALALFLFACGYLFWPVRRKKTAIDFVIGAMFCVLGLIQSALAVWQGRRDFIGLIGLAAGVVFLLIGVGLFLKRGTVVETKPEEPPLL